MRDAVLSALLTLAAFAVLFAIFGEYNAHTNPLG